MERLLQRDVWLRVLSVGLAFVLWAMVTGAETRSTERFANVEVGHNLPADLRITDGNIPSQVTVTLEGSVLELAKIGRVRAFVDFSGLSSGRHTLPIRVPDLPAGIKAVVEPGEVALALERITSRELAVTLAPELRDQLVHDVQYRLQPTNQTITVSGVESRVAQVARVEIITDISGITETGAKEMLVRAVDSSGREVPNLILQPDSVNVHVAVHPLPPAKSVAVKPRFMGTPPEGYAFSYTVEPQTVRVRGPRTYHSQWAEVTTEPISLIGQTQSFTVNASLVKPQGADLVDQETVTVSITVYQTKLEHSIDGVPLQVRNLAGNLQADVALKAVSVRVRGYKAALDQLDPGSLQVYLDLEDRGPGTHTLPVRFVPPAEGIEVLGVFPGEVDVTVTGPPPTPEQPQPGDPPPEDKTGP